MVNDGTRSQLTNALNAVDQATLDILDAESAVNDAYRTLVEVGGTEWAGAILRELTKRARTRQKVTRLS